MKRGSSSQRDSVPKKGKIRTRWLMMFMVVMVAAFLFWAIPIHHAPSKIVIDLEGRARVYTRWVFGAREDSLFLPDRVPVFTRDRTGAERPGYRVQVQEQTRQLTEWRTPTRLRRTLGSIYRLEWSDTTLMDGHYTPDSDGISPILLDDVGVDYSVLRSWKGW